MKKQIMVKRLLVVLFLFVVVCSVSCTDASRAKLGGYGGTFKVELLNCDGTVAREWISSGKVQSESNSDGYYFNEKSTGTLTEVTGTLVITKQ